MVTSWLSTGSSTRTCPSCRPGLSSSFSTASCAPLQTGSLGIELRLSVIYVHHTAHYHYLKVNIPGFLLADAGYDVWLGNFRGNIYSRNHTHLDPDQEQFWQFSWDQMGQLDLPAMLFHVTRHTGQHKLVYVGHSMGTTAFWVMMNRYTCLRKMMMILTPVCRYPEMNSMVQLMVGMAPVAAAAHMYSPVKYISPVAGPVEVGQAGREGFSSKNSTMFLF